MALPEIYTEASFAKYIRNEVLQYVADAMEWNTIVTIEDPIEESYFKVYKTHGLNSGVLRVMRLDGLTTESTPATKRQLINSFLYNPFALRNVGDTDYEENEYRPDPYLFVNPDDESHPQSGVLYYQERTYEENGSVYATTTNENSASDSTLYVSATDAEIPAGAKILYATDSNGTKFWGVVAVTAPIGSTTITMEEPVLNMGFPRSMEVWTLDEPEYIIIKILPYLDREVADGTMIEVRALPEEQSILADDPIYKAILDETLFAIGKNSLEEVDTETELVRLRAMGRVEAWRFVMCNCAAMTSSETQEGNFFNRAEVFFSARDQLTFAEQEYGRLFGLSISNDPAFETTTTSKVKGVW